MPLMSVNLTSATSAPTPLPKIGFCKNVCKADCQVRIRAEGCAKFVGETKETTKKKIAETIPKAKLRGDKMKFSFSLNSNQNQIPTHNNMPPIPGESVKKMQIDKITLKKTNNLEFIQLNLCARRSQIVPIFK